jgi:hypothetical protein
MSKENVLIHGGSRSCLFIDTNLSQQIFTRRDTRGFRKRNIFEYKIILFPVYVNYWTLLVLDLG